MRQHVNPLSRFFQVQLELPEPKKLFVDSDLPIHLDIGSARGRFLIQLASIEKKWNFLGIDIRSKLVNHAERERQELDLHNLRFLFCNANVSLRSWMSNLKPGQLQSVSIQFPDPWFKKRHQKRRVFNSSLMIDLAAHLVPGSKIFVQSDVLSVIDPIVELINLSGCFDKTCNSSEHWLKNNPFKITTEREQYAIDNCLPIYRALFIRNYTDVPNLQEIDNQSL